MMDTTTTSMEELITEWMDESSESAKGTNDSFWYIFAIIIPILIVTVAVLVVLIIICKRRNNYKYSTMRHSTSRIM